MDAHVSDECSNVYGSIIDVLFQKKVHIKITKEDNGKIRVAVSCLLDELECTTIILRWGDVGSNKKPAAVASDELGTSNVTSVSFG